MTGARGCVLDNRPANITSMDRWLTLEEIEVKHGGVDLGVTTALSVLTQRRYTVVDS